MNRVAVQIRKWLMQPMVWRFVGVASSVVGLLCYGLSSSFNYLFGKWIWWKIFVYVIFSIMICLALLLAKKRQRPTSRWHKANLAFLVLTITCVYSFFFDKVVKGKPDAYSLISSTSFAIMSLSLSIQTHCGVEVDLLYFFCTILTAQLMKIKLLLGIPGLGFSYSLVILRPRLDGLADPVLPVQDTQLNPVLPEQLPVQGTQLNSLLPVQIDEDDLKSGLLRIRIKRGVNLVVPDLRSSNPYVVVKMAKQKLKTRVIKSIKEDINPEWNEDLTLAVTDAVRTFKLMVYDYDPYFTNDYIGDAEFDLTPYIEALKMNLENLPSGTIITRIQPSRQNCLAEESCITYTNGKVIQDVVLQLRRVKTGVKAGEVEIQLQWIDLPGSKGS